MDDYMYDQDTGEIVEDDRQRMFEEQFKINDRKTADWVLKKILECDSQLLEITLRKKQIMENIDYQLNEQLKHRDYLMGRFGPELEAFAEVELKDSKKQSMQLDYGKIGFRACAGSTKVKDKINAIQWLEKQMYLNAVSINKSVSVSNIPDGVELPDDLFERVGPHRKFYIDSGVK
jgi:hypothetical protein